MPTYIFFRKMK